MYALTPEEKTAFWKWWRDTKTSEDHMPEPIQVAAWGIAHERERATAKRWQPIETAPTDGTRILAWGPCYRFGPMIIACDAVPGDWTSDISYAAPPTHWMPLLAPPGAD